MLPPDMESYIRPHIPLNALQQIELFQDLTPEELEQLSSRLRVLSAPRETLLWKEGEAPTAVYFLRSGQLKLQQSIGGETVTLATLGPGASFGETSLLTGEPHRRTMRVSIDATLWLLDKNDFEALLAKHPNMALSLSRMLARRLHHETPQTDYSSTKESRRLVGVLGDEGAALAVAGQVAVVAQADVVVVDTVDTGDENSTLDPSEPFYDIVTVAEGVDRLGIPIELSSGDLSEVVSHLLTRYHHVFVRLPESGGPRLTEALELCEVIIAPGGGMESPAIRERVPSEKLWCTDDTPGERDPGRRGRDIGRLARRIGGMRVGLALSSGGAHGLAHIGVLSVLDREGIPVDLIAGTSMGSLIAGAYAAGRRGKQLYRVGKEVSIIFTVKQGWRMWDLTLPRSGMIRGGIMERKIERWVRGKSFEELEIPAFVAAVEVVSGRGVIFSQGSLSHAVRASCSIPLLFEPVPHGEDYVMDGAAVEPVPCRSLAEAGADIIIASNVIPQVEDRLYRGVRQRVGPGRPPRMMDVYNSEREIMSAQVAALKMQPYDVLVQPKVGMYSWTESEMIDLFIERGVEAAEQVLPQIRTLLRPGRHKRKSTGG